MLTLEASSFDILIIDDTPDNLRLLASILESQAFTVRKSLNGRTALRAVHRNPPDLILLDINMPDLNGYEVCQRLKAAESTRHIPIIFISALDQAQEKVRAFELGGHDYITKPFQELEVIARVKNQLLIQHQQKLVIQQNQLLQQENRDRQAAEAQVRQLNVDLERQVHMRTLELHQALSCELALRQISNQVRDSLDQHCILQTAVRTLAWALEVHCCKVTIYSTDHSTTTIQYQWVQPNATAIQEQPFQVENYLELHAQLRQQNYFAFCPLEPSSIANHAAILACPIFDDRVDETGILGGLWLFREVYSSFSEIEIHLVQQTATQCAIALRQARLYEAAQAQVKELERLNQLKDDFLNTISHELRTPIASMQMILSLLTTVTNQGRNLVEELSKSPTQDNRVAQYFNLLQEECDRELALIEDLLHLQHIEAGTYGGEIASIQLHDLISYLIEPFEMRTQNQQQTLQVHIPDELPALQLDSFGLSRVITELLTNACKYTPAGETISISVTVFQNACVSEANATLSIPYFQLVIANTGVEIPAEELPRIFDKFYRIPNHDPWRHGGTGLGLALVKKLVEHMQGSIEVESDRNLTQFTLKLPLTVNAYSHCGTKHIFR